MRKMSQRKLAVAGILSIMVLIIMLLIVPTLTADGYGESVMINMDDGECAVFVDNDQALGFSAPIDASRTKQVIANNTAINKTFQCEVEDYTDYYYFEYGIVLDKGITYNSHDYINPANGEPAFDCRVFFEGVLDVTRNWQQTINSAGDLKLTCQFTKQ